MEKTSDIISKVKEEAQNLEMGREDIASIIDFTELSPYVKEKNIRQLCERAIDFEFHSVAVNPYYVDKCSDILSQREVKITSTIGFPLGQIPPELKALETEKVRENGADEIDMVMNIAAFRDEENEVVRDEIGRVVDASGDCSVKVILETGYLTYEEIEKACKVVKESGADFVKNSTGFGPCGANIPHIYLMRKSVGDDFGVKAAGGIGSFADSLLMVAAGADRIGSSSGVEILESYERDEKLDFENSSCSASPCVKISEEDVPSSVYEYYQTKCSD